MCLPESGSLSWEFSYTSYQGVIQVTETYFSGAPAVSNSPSSWETTLMTRGCGGVASEGDRGDGS